MLIWLGVFELICLVGIWGFIIDILDTLREISSKLDKDPGHWVIEEPTEVKGGIDY